jgi:hypothetical protein
MARRSRPTSHKRNKERARQKKQKDKAARRLEAKERKTDVGSDVGGKDVDIAGIRPGPQPLPEQWDYIGSAD